MKNSLIFRFLVFFGFQVFCIGCNRDFQANQATQNDLEKNNLKGEISAVLEVEEFYGGDKIETLNIYNEKGMLLRELRNSDSMGMSDLIFTYDNSGRLIKQSGYNSRLIEYEYDDEGRLIKEVSVPDSSNYFSWGAFYISHTYNRKNLIRTEGNYNYMKDEQFSRDIQYFYDKSGKLFKSIELYLTNKEEKEATALYNDRGLKVSVTSDESRTLYTYNEFGDLTAEEKFTITEGKLSNAIYYKYSDRDHNGNYLVKEKIEDDFKIKVTRRVIYCPGDDFSEIVKRFEEEIQLELTI